MKNYFKKLIIMFVMAFAVIGVGTIQNGIVVNAATVGEQLTTPESGWRRYDNTDSKIVYHGDWTALSLNGSYNSTNNTSISDKNPYYEFKFYGTKFRILTTLDSTHTFKIQLTVDGTSYNYSERSESQLKCALEFEKTDLARGIHIVKVQKMTTDSTYFTQDAIDIDSDGKLVPCDELISLNKSSIDLTPGDTEQLTATTTPVAVEVTWTSSDESVATVDSTGKVTAIKKGQATITATINDEYNVNVSCRVNVTPIDPSMFVPSTRTINSKPLSEDITLTASDLGISSSESSGDIKMTARNIAQNGWLICDGSAISRTTYSSLFSAIGTTYGSGDGSTTFNIPNLKGKVPVGFDSSQTEFNILGKTGGSKTHTNTIDEMAHHNHSFEGFAGSTNAASGRSIRGNTAGRTTNNTGNGQPYSIMNPYLAINYIIKY